MGANLYGRSRKGQATPTFEMGDATHVCKSTIIAAFSNVGRTSKIIRNATSPHKSLSMNEGSECIAMSMADTEVISILDSFTS